MKAIIMAGGFGTRLRPLTCKVPKPMVPVVNRPMMEHIIMLLKEHQITEMVALLFHQAESISDYFGDGTDFGVKMEYIRPDADYGTAGAVRCASELINEPFLVISGDLLTDFDLTSIINFHNQKKALATITLTRVTNPLEYGIVITDQNDRISRFLEKPTWGQVFSDTINSGIYVFQPEIFKDIPPGKEFDFSKDLFPAILAQKKPLYGRITNGYWRDIGNIAEYRQAHLDALKGEVRIEVEGDRLNLIGKDIWVGKGSNINAKNSKLTGAVIIGKNVMVGQGTHLHDVVIGDNCVIGENAFIEHSIIWANSKIGEKTRVGEAIVCDQVEIGRQAIIEQNVILSKQAKIGNQAQIMANVKVWPGKSVDDQAVLSSSLIWGDRWLKEFFAGPRVTGLANMEMTPEFAAKLGAAYGALLGKGSVMLTSRDSHPVSRMINRALISGLLSAGVKVHELRAVPIPIVRYQLKAGGEQGGLHTRKSPFDAKMVDIIFFDKDGKDLPAGKIKNLERMFLREDFTRAEPEDTGVIEYPHRVMEGYREGLLSYIDTQAIREARYKVVIDYAYGAAANTFPSILGALGIEVVALNAFENSEKLTKTGEDFVGAQQRLAQMVQSLKADVGFLLDSGAERVYLVDEQGRIMDEDIALATVSLLVMKSRKIKELAVPVTASRAIEELAEKYQIKVKRTRIDNRSLIEEAAGEAIAFVASRRGGYIFPEFQPAFDAMLSITKILELMAVTGSRLGSISGEIPQSHMIKRNIPCPWSKKGLVLRTLMEQTKDHPEKQLIDGIKLFYGRDWVQVLPDPNRELFHINAEADDAGKAQKLVDEYTRKIEECLK